MNTSVVLTDPDNSPGISEEEVLVLADLLRRMKNTQWRGTVFHAGVQKVPSVPLELIVLDTQSRVLLAYRDDHEFKGWHHPGSVWNDWETIPQRRTKLVAGEVVKGAGIQITEPKSIGWVGVYRGTEPDNNASRNACSIIHIANLIGEFTPKDGYGFFPIESPPKDTLGCHKYMLRRVAQYLKDGVALCD